MKSIAFVFSSAPHGNSISREGLDLILSFSVFSNKIALFFIDDGVFQLMKHQKPELIKLYNYSLSFKILSLYDIKDFFFVKNQLIREV
ncbi:Protein TusC [Buchnera aphidicola (Cinara piceae)]|uniref:Protein TusC n=1 Tax=Buchnera aphidicola (Cinara piceae) TaxID=1660043 RepID=A0A803GD57_9GAMM|nr:Protein TusC [Buchnera aphidicola (Cinara piceae)]